LGGPSLIRALWQRGAIDQLGLILLPILFGQGLPLFPLDPDIATRHLCASAICLDDHHVAVAGGGSVAIATYANE
jgi:riboflavin biosynthesis pyrimidine reductase